MYPVPHVRNDKAKVLETAEPAASTSHAEPSNTSPEDDVQAGKASSDPTSGSGSLPPPGTSCSTLGTQAGIAGASPAHIDAEPAPRHGEPLVSGNLEPSPSSEPSPASSDVCAPDPLDALKEAMFMSVLRKLEAWSLAQCLLVCQAWNRVASDGRLWEPLCEQLFQGKAHIFPELLTRGDIERSTAYALSMQDSARVTITEHDLCTRVWEMRFKEWSGTLEEESPASSEEARSHYIHLQSHLRVVRDYWSALDPSRTGAPPMLRAFHRDGDISPLTNDEVFHAQESAWAFVRPHASTSAQSLCVQVRHWPLLNVSRTEDWRWRLESSWVTYTSMPDAQAEAKLEELRQSAEWMADRSFCKWLGQRSLFRNGSSSAEEGPSSGSPGEERSLSPGEGRSSSGPDETRSPLSTDEWGGSSIPDEGRTDEGGGSSSPDDRRVDEGGGSSSPDEGRGSASLDEKSGSAEGSSAEGSSLASLTESMSDLGV